MWVAHQIASRMNLWVKEEWNGDILCVFVYLFDYLFGFWSGSYVFHVGLQLHSVGEVTWDF